MAVHQIGCDAPERQSAAREIQKLVDAIADYSEAVMTGSWSKLTPILPPPTLTPNGEEPKAPEQMMPPLFNDLRTRLWQIQSNLASIETAIRLTEI
jgi:hypothetical protein